jgi:phage-related tail fiber protein
MSRIALSGNPLGTGTFTLASPNSNSDRTLNLPDASGTMVVTGSTELTPPGTVIWYAANAAPTGYLKANGAAVSRTTYAALFTAIGTTFGAGDGSTTFALPDLRGEFIRGWDDGRAVDSGRAFGSAQLDQMQRITGQFTPISGERFDSNTSATGALSVVIVSGSDITNGASGTGGAIGFNSANSPDARVSSTTAGETRSRNVALLACIKF